MKWANEKLLTAMKLYESTFGDGFPLMCFSDKSPEKAVQIINECVEQKKDVYDLGYLFGDVDIQY